MSNIFDGCSSLISLSDISNWNTSNVTNMRLVFAGCSSLKSLPDISKWNISNVINMSYMFFECNNFTSLPDISKWNVLNVNLLGKVICTQYAIPLLKESENASIVNIASRLGTKPCEEASAYCSAEAGIINFTRSKCA